MKNIYKILGVSTLALVLNLNASANNINQEQSTKNSDLQTKSNNILPNINEQDLLGTWACEDKQANNQVHSKGITKFYSGGTFKEKSIINFPLSFLAKNRYKNSNDFLSYSLVDGVGKWNVNKEKNEFNISVSNKYYFSKIKPAYNKTILNKINEDKNLQKISDKVLTHLNNTSSQTVTRLIISLTNNEMVFEDYSANKYPAKVTKLVKMSKQDPKALNNILTTLNKNGANYTKYDIKKMTEYVPAVTVCKKLSSN